MLSVLQVLHFKTRAAKVFFARSIPRIVCGWFLIPSSVSPDLGSVAGRVRSFGLVLLR